MSRSQKYTIAFAWFLPNEKELFDMFPEVIIIDTVFASNNENRPLLTIGAKYYMGKMFILLRVFLLHEQYWVFRWVFSRCVYGYHMSAA